ncbi:hypothetical protein Hdeb2414_s0003g00106191 [Helianthus debilis subsp. tardiflorus]
MKASLLQGKGIVDYFLICFVKEMALLTCLLDDLNVGDLGGLGDFEVKGAPKKQVEKTVRGRHRKKPEPAVVPHLVPHATNISYSRFRRYANYVVVSDTLKGLGVPGGCAAVGGSSAGSKAAGEKRKRKVEEKAVAAGEKKRLRLQPKWTTAVSQTKPAVVAEPQDGGFSLFDTPPSPTHDAAADAGWTKGLQ